jgi:hypothetical protein
MRRVSGTIPIRALVVTWAVVLGLGAACSGRNNAEVDRLFSVTTDWPAFAQGPNGEPPRGAVDVLFMVDNSSSMAPLQEKLAAGFVSFMTAIDTLPGGVPDLHIGVVSSDLGATSDVPGCGPVPGQPTTTSAAPPVDGDGGRLQFQPRGACTDTTLEPGARYIALRTDPATGARVTNYTGALPDVFSCIALLGDVGCGFERQLASVRRALDPAKAPAENAGFLRPGAFLAVILVTDEDDCSARDPSAFYDVATNVLLSSPLGPPGSFRCAEFGTLCSVDGRLASPSRTEAASYEGCVSNEHGRLESVSDFVAFLRNLKGDPGKVFVATVAGPASPFAVQLKPAAVTTDAMWPDISPSCTASDSTTRAYPGVRLVEMTGLLGARGVFASICGETMDEPLGQIARVMTGPLGPACVAAPSAGCNVVDRWLDGDRVRHAAQLTACAESAGATPCWSLVEDAACASGLQRLSVDRTDSPAPAGLMTAIDCSGQVL